MTTKIHYSEEDDIFTIYDDEHKPNETIEFSEVLNIDINEDFGIVGLEVFYASDFFSALNNLVTKKLLGSAKNVSIKCKNYRNNYWLMTLIFKNNGNEIKVQLPPLRKSEYKSPLIASCE